MRAIILAGIALTFIVAVVSLSQDTPAPEQEAAAVTPVALAGGLSTEHKGRDAGVKRMESAAPALRPRPRQTTSYQDRLQRVLEAQTWRRVRARGAWRNEDVPLFVNKKQLKDQISEQSVPIMSECYENAGDNVAGRVAVEFKVAAEPGAGGIVVESRLLKEETDPTLLSHPLADCIVESMYALEFEEPSRGGMLTIRYPFTFQPYKGDQ